MMPLNKIVMSHIPHAPFTVVGGQMIGSACLLLLVAPTYTLRSDDAVRCLVLSPIFASMLVVSMVSLRFASFGAIMAIRNTAPLFALPLEHVCIAPQRITIHTIGSLLCIVGGCVAYVWYDVHTTPLGLVLASLNMALGVMDRMLQRHLLSTTDIPKTAMLLVNNGLGSVLVACLALATREDIHAALANADARVPWISSALSGLLLGYSGALAQTHVGATTHLVVTNINRVIVLLLGAYGLGDTVAWQGWVSAGVAIWGALWYAWKG